MNRKLGVTIGLLIVLSFVGFIGINIFKNTFDKDATIENIAEAIQEENIKYLKDYIEVEGYNEPLSDKYLAEIVTLLRDNDVHKNIQMYIEDSDSSLSLEYKGKEKFFFDKYTLALGRYNLDVESNMAGCKVYIDDVVVGEFDKNIYDTYTLGPIAMDGSISLLAKAEINGETYESDIYAVIENNYNYDLYIDYEEIDLEYEIHQLMENYQYNMVESINWVNFSYVEPFLKEGSPLMDSQKNLVERLGNDGIAEELISYVIHEIYEVSDNLYETVVTEDHNIYYLNGDSKQVSNSWIYTIAREDNNFYMQDIRRAN